MRPSDFDCLQPAAESVKPLRIPMQAEELSYVIVTPYSMRKSRTGGIVSRLISRTGLDLVGGRMFAPGEELVRRYTETIVSSTDPRHRATQKMIRDYVQKNFTGERQGQQPRVLLLVFRGPARSKKSGTSSAISCTSGRAARRSAILTAITSLTNPAR